jgi:hypothetical protein
MEKAGNKRTIKLDGDRLMDRQSLRLYMHELFTEEKKIDVSDKGILDLLMQIEDDTDICLSKKCVGRVCGSVYAFHILGIIGKASDQNPHIMIHFI